MMEGKKLTGGHSLNRSGRGGEKGGGNKFGEKRLKKWIKIDVMAAV